MDLRANVSSEVEILCNQTECSLKNPATMAVAKDQMYVSLGEEISVFEGESIEALNSFNAFKACNALKTKFLIENSAVSTHVWFSSQLCNLLEMFYRCLTLLLYESLSL